MGATDSGTRGCGGGALVVRVSVMVQGQGEADKAEGPDQREAEEVKRESRVYDS